MRKAEAKRKKNVYPGELKLPLLGTPAMFDGGNRPGTLGLPAGKNFASS